MTNSTDPSDYDWKYEYYYDYLDPIIVDEKKLKFNKYSIVIIFWTGMAAFVVFLFLVLMYLSRSGSQATVWVPVHKSHAAKKDIERSPEEATS